jgi:hypothetical protein
MKGCPFHIHWYTVFIHWLILQFIFSYPITSLHIHRYPKITFDIHKDIHLFILAYPSTYPVISIDLSYYISFNIHSDIQLLIHEYPSNHPSDIYCISQDILPFILLDIVQAWSGCIVLHKQQCSYFSASRRGHGNGTRRPGDGATAPPGRSGPGDRAACLVEALLRSDCAAGLRSDGPVGSDDIEVWDVDIHVCLISKIFWQLWYQRWWCRNRSDWWCQHDVSAVTPDAGPQRASTDTLTFHDAYVSWCLYRHDICVCLYRHYETSISKLRFCALILGTILNFNTKDSALNIA